MELIRTHAIVRQAVLTGVAAAAILSASVSHAGSISIGFKPLDISATPAARLDGFGPAGSSNFLNLVVSDSGNRTVRFELRNNSSTSVAVTDIYFDDLTNRAGFTSPQVLGSIVGIEGTLGVSMVTDGSSGNPYSFTMQAQAMAMSSPVSLPPRFGVNQYPELPGGDQSSLPFLTSASVWEMSSGNYHAAGVGPGQWVDVTFALAPQRTFDDVINDIANGYGLRVGLLLQGASPNSSQMQSYESVPVPLPPALASGAALIAGMGTLALVRRRWNERRNFSSLV